MAEPVVPPCMCGLDRRATVHVYDAPPAGEVTFALSGGRYRRELRRCEVDGHIVSVHDMDMSGLYDGTYVDATYGADGMRRTFERVTALPPERSDNAGRVRRIEGFAAANLSAAPRRALDVGSGTGVFPHRLHAAGWDVLALDPDPRAVVHLRTVAGVPAVHADFLAADPATLGRHHLVTFNKVLEHVVDPRAMLARALRLLEPDGVVYVELPDADGAAAEGFGREEFFIDHHHVFTMASAALLAARAGFAVREAERIQEPSSKHTLRLFLVAG